MAALQGISLEALKEAMKESVREENKELVKRMDAVEANQQDTKRLLTETIGRVSALEGHGLPSSGALSSVSSTAATVETPFSGFGGGFGGNSDVGFGFAKPTSWGGSSSIHISTWSHLVGSSASARPGDRNRSVGRWEHSARQAGTPHPHTAKPSAVRWCFGIADIYVCCARCECL